MTDKPSDSERRGYHHGNLKEELVRAALSLISEKGASGFTFAEAARLAGVSPAAPYRHYRDKVELMADVAMRGFVAFEQALSRAWNDARPDAWTAFMRLGQAYIAFANDEPAYYSAMFEAGVPLDAAPGLRSSADRAFQTLRTAAETLIAALPPGRRPPSLMVALHIWAMAHGIASLFVRPDAGRRPLPMSAGDLLEANVLIYLQGLGLSPGGGQR